MNKDARRELLNEAADKLVEALEGVAKLHRGASKREPHEIVDEAHELLMQARRDIWAMKWEEQA